MISQGSQKMEKKTQINPPLDTPLVQSRALVQKIHPKTDCRLISLLIPGPSSGGLRAYILKATKFAELAFQPQKIVKKMRKS